MAMLLRLLYPRWWLLWLLAAPGPRVGWVDAVGNVQVGPNIQVGGGSAAGESGSQITLAQATGDFSKAWVGRSVLIQSSPAATGGGGGR